jgi:hypothetical protein
MRIALLTFALLAGLGVLAGHVWQESPQPRVDDRGTAVRIKL